MKSRTSIILVACAGIALAGGWYFGTATESTNQTAASDQLAFPDLASKLPDATSVEITHQGNHIVIEKHSGSPGWVVASLQDYPVQDSKLRGLLTGLTDLRLVEPRTSNPSEFGRLGVDDPDSKVATANLVQVMDSHHAPIAAMIIGHRKVRAQGDLPDQVYVRRPGGNQSWLADGTVPVESDPENWLDRSILNIGADRIASVVVGDKTLMFGRVAGRFTLTEPTDHPKLDDFKINDVARALEMLSFQQVRSDSAMPPQTTDTGSTQAVFTTTDGLAIDVTVLHSDQGNTEKNVADKPVWVRFSAPVSDTMSDKTKAEARALNARLSGWTYEIGSWKEASLVPTLNELKAPEPAATARSSMVPKVTAPPAMASPSVASPGALSPGAPSSGASPPGAPASDSAPAVPANAR